MAGIGNVTLTNVGYPNGIGIGIGIGAGAGAGAGVEAGFVAKTTETQTTAAAAVATTIVRYDYIFSGESSRIRSFFAVIYLSSNMISAICLVLLIRLYFSKRYHKVHEKNLNSACVSLLAINVLKWANLLWENRLVNETLMQMNVIATFLLLTTATDLYLTLKSVIKDIFVEEAASRRRFAVYSICGWLLPVVVLRALFALQLHLQYSRRDFAFALVQLHCCLNFVAVVLIHAGLRSYYRYSNGRGRVNDTVQVEGYKYYSDEKYTSDVVCFLSSMRFVFHLSFLITRKHVALSILDFFRAYEGMYIYYRLAVQRPNECKRSYESEATVVGRRRHLESQSCTSAV